MDCLEFRRIVPAEPRRPGAGATAYAATCAACQKFLRRAPALEGKLEAALNIDAPAGLAGGLLAKVRRGTGRRRWLALAASLLVAAALGFLLVAPRSDPLALAAIDFVVFDEAHAVAVASPQDMRVLAGISRAMRVSLPEQLGKIHYVCRSPAA